MTEYVNLTWHTLSFIVEGQTINIKPSGKVARVPCREIVDGHETIEGAAVPVTRVTYMRRVENLPEPKTGVVYLVSSKCAEIARRGDVMSPNTNGKFRVTDENGKIIGCTALQRWV